jgi:predicted metal-dependent peptidase
MKHNINDIRGQLAVRFPMFITFLVDNHFEADENVKTLSSNGHVIKYNPHFIGRLTPADVFFMFAHELCHCFFGHHLRYHEDWSKERQNEAMDYSTNALLIMDGLTRPSSALYKHEWRNLAFEEVYQLLEEQNQKEDKQQQKKLKQAGFSNPMFDKPKGGFDENKHGEVEPSPDLDPEEESEDPLSNGEQQEKRRQELMQQHDNKMREAVQAAMMMGSMSQTVKEHFDQLFKAKSNWKDIFAEYLVKCTDLEEFTYMRPNKRSEDIILPSMYSERGPSVCFCGDSSCSVTHEKLRAMASEVVGLMEDVNPEKLIVMWCDTQVGFYRVFEEGEEPITDPVGRGGTDFRPPFERLAKEQEDVDVFVYMTDGECSRFPERPDYPVVWLVYGRYAPHFKPPFGEVVIYE